MTSSQKTELVKVDSLLCHPKNPRKGNLDIIVQSIQINGFYGCLVAQKGTRHVLAGNHRLKAAGIIGIEKVPVMWVDCTEEEAERILLADNRTMEPEEYLDAIS